MKRIITEQLAVTSNNNVAQIEYSPTFFEEKKGLTKVLQAIITLDVTSQTRTDPKGFKVFSKLGSEEPVVIDYVVNAGKNKKVAIDITDELNDLIQFGHSSVSISISGDVTEPITFVGMAQAHVKYEIIKNFSNQNNTISFDAGVNGQGKVNLFNGNLIFSKNLLSTNGILPINLVANYNSLNSNTDYYTFITHDWDKYAMLPNSLKNGWNLNYNQFLVKQQKKDELFQENIAESFIYFDGFGNSHDILVKYYYEDETGKHYLKNNQITIDENKKLWFKNVKNKYLEVKTEQINNTGLKLVNNPDGFINLELVKQEIEEIESLENQVTELQKYLNQCIDAMIINETSVKLNEDSDRIKKFQYNLQELTNKSENFELSLQKDFKSDKYKYIENYNNYVRLSDNRVYSQIDNAGTELGYKRNFQDAQSNMELKTIEHNYGAKIDGKGEIENRLIINDLNKKLISVLNDYSNNEKVFNEHNLKSERAKLNTTYDSYFLQLRRQKFKLEKMKNLVPEQYLTDSSGKIYGFSVIPNSFNNNEDENTSATNPSQNLSITPIITSKLDIPSIPSLYGGPIFVGDYNNSIAAPPPKPDPGINNLKLSYYRLVLVADKYENAIYINYVDDVSMTNCNFAIKSITNNKNILFNFVYELENEFGKLKSITDNCGRVVNFSYNAEHLSEIDVCGTTCFYGYDEFGNLNSLLDNKGFATSLEYNSNKVVKINKSTTTETISENGIEKHKNNLGEEVEKQFNLYTINYYNAFSTMITDKFENITTYVFNNTGKVKHVYENQFNLDNTNFINPKSISFDYVEKNKTFSAMALPNAPELTAGASFENIENTIINENYVGDAICEEDLIPLSYMPINQVITLADLPDAENKICMHVLPEKLAYINEIKPNVLVLSGWAKADSAYFIEPTELIEDDSLNEIMVSSFDSIKQNRKFNLTAIVSYETQTITFSVNFDWLNNNWQNCICPIILNSELGNIISIELQFDYSFNTNGANFVGISLKEGTLNESCYDDDGKLCKTYDSATNLTTTYLYNNNDQVVKNVFTLGDGQTLENVFEYNLKGELVRSIDCFGMVEENVFNDKGIVTKTLKYNLKNPANKLVEEKLTNEEGKKIGELNSMGEKIADYEFNQNFGEVECVKLNNGGTQSFGYDYKTRDLVAISQTVNDETNENLLTKNFGLLTGIYHNDFNINYAYDGFSRLNEIKIAGNTYAKIKHEDCFLNPNMLQKTTQTTLELGNGESFVTVLDSHGNVLNISYVNPSGVAKTILSNHYNFAGNLIGTTDAANSEIVETSIEYNKNNEPIKKSYRIFNTEVVESNQINEFGNVTKFVYSVDGNNKIENTYNYSKYPQNKLTSTCFMDGLAEELEFDELNRLKKVSLNGMTQQISYQKVGSRTSMLPVLCKHSVLNAENEAVRYVYDKLGNITHIYANGLLKARYAYDELNRIIREDNAEIQKSYTFSYDLGGNITQKVEHDFSLNENLGGGNKFSYVYKTDGWNDQMLSFNGLNCAYDRLGNPTTYLGNTLNWEMGRNLISFNNINLKYNANGLRVQKTTPEGTTNYYYSGNKLMGQTNQDGQMWFLYGANGIVGFNYTTAGSNETQTFLYKKDILGNVIGIFDKNRTEIVKYAYNSYGLCEIYTLNNFVQIDTKNGILYNNIGNINPIRYRGYYFDTDLDLYYLHSRYYDAKTGRFINADDISILSQTQTDINGINLYMYCANNPIMHTDSYGTNFWHDVWNGIKQVWDVIVGVVVSTACVVGGVLITIGSGGTLGKIGFGLIGAGVGGLLGGIQSKENGNSFWSGYLGGFVAGGAIGYGISTGYIGTLLFGTIGHFAENIITDSINGETFDKNYWLNLTGESLLFGLISSWAQKYSEALKLINITGFRDIFAALTILSEFAFAALFDGAKNIIKDFVEILRRKIRL